MGGDFHTGNDLVVYVATKFDEFRYRLWSTEVTEAVSSAGCDVEKHDRGLRSWAVLGGHIIIIPTPGLVGSDLAEYDPIREWTRPALDQQLRRHVFLLGAEIEHYLGIHAGGGSG